MCEWVCVCVYVSVSVFECDSDGMYSRDARYVSCVYANGSLHLSCGNHFEFSCKNGIFRM